MKKPLRTQIPRYNDSEVNEIALLNYSKYADELNKDQLGQVEAVLDSLYFKNNKEDEEVFASQLLIE